MSGLLLRSLFVFSGLVPIISRTGPSPLESNTSALERGEIQSAEGVEFAIEGVSFFAQEFFRGGLWLFA